MERVCSRSLAGVSCSNPVKGMDVCVACCKYRQKAKCRTIKTKTQMRIKYRVQENIKKIQVAERYSTHVQTGLGVHTACCTMGNWVKRPGRGVNHPPPSRAEVQERVELYLYSPPGPSWPVLGRPLPFFR